MASIVDNFQCITWQHRQIMYQLLLIKKNKDVICHTNNREKQ